jgi:23S rRNA (adenine2503-C2)-methyltransferase
MDRSQSIIGLNLDALRAYALDHGFPEFHGNQVFKWVYKRQIHAFDLMTDLPKGFRELLKRDFTLSFFNPSRVLQSRNKDTIKYFFPLEEGTGIEAVVLHDNGRRTTFCISSQIGCPVKCIYCATGNAGFVRDLDAGEILTQVLSLMKKHGEPDSILFMGMGEPLLNLWEVKEAIGLFHEMDLSSRRITVSTCGLVRGIRDLACSGLKPRLAVSLGSALDAKRKKLIPFARGNSLDQLRKALVFYREKTKRRITIEYTLLSGLNDTDEDARALASFARSTRSHVNLIRYNPMPQQTQRRVKGESSQTRIFPPKTERVRNFTQVLVDRKVGVTERYRRGSDINAACGQLLFTQS